ncbi:MAG TPA: hypothetical protein V6C81_29050 [Planktothrix sp.]
MDNLAILVVVTIIASLFGSIFAIRTGGLRATNADTRTQLALRTGAIVGGLLGLFAGWWFFVAAITGALGAWILSIVLYNRKMN